MKFKAFQKRLRIKLMPKGEDLAKLTQSKLKINKKEVKRKFNICLKRLLDIEFRLYKKYERECSREIIEQALQRGMLTKGESFGEIFEKNYDNLWDLFLSISQSRKARAGGSFENHVRYLFGFLGYPFDIQRILNGKVDYVIPSEKAFKTDRTRCVVISIKHTLRERWRQVAGELASTKAGKIYLLTVDEELSNKKVNEIAGHNITLVTTDEFKKRKFKDNPRIIGFTEFVKRDLPASKKFWELLVKSKE